MEPHRDIRPTYWLEECLKQLSTTGQSSSPQLQLGYVNCLTRASCNFDDNIRNPRKCGSGRVEVLPLSSFLDFPTLDATASTKAARICG